MMEFEPPHKVAIVGAAGRFPGAGNLMQFWDLLRQGAVVVGEPDPERPERSELWRAMRDPALAPKITTLKAGYLDDIAGFDAAFFNISPREAVKLDPQQRLLLETTRAALDDAAIVHALLQSSRVGVYVGAGSSDHITLDSGDKQQIDAYHGLGNSHSLLANRLSYQLNLKGPSLCVDTACSSSLTALHVALQALELGEIDFAIVGGVNAIVSPDLTLAFSQAKMLSPSGRCNTFSASADGYGRAEAAGVVILCRLDDAERAGRRIRCVIRASAVNQDGRSNGITAPNGTSQVAVIEAAMARARVSPDDIAYVEAHGTGTPLGDAIEFGALKAVFGPSPHAHCIVGSVKANIGHAEAAAGICGLLKAMLMLEHAMVPPHPVGPPYNSMLDNSAGKLRLCAALEPMPPARRCIGVSGFGFGGSNAHVIVERHEAPVNEHDQPSADVLIALSSHFSEGLEADARELAACIARSDAPLEQIGATLARGRDHLARRQTWTVASRDELQHKLLEYRADAASAALSGSRPKLAFVFTGQGAQYVGMGRELYHHHAGFRARFDQCDALIRQASGISVAQRLYEEGPLAAGDDLMEDTHRAQLSLFCLEYALAHLWIDAGIEPDYLIGHSVGELCAHAVAGTLALADAVALLNARGALMQGVGQSGAMLAVSCDEAAMLDMIARAGAGLAIAAVNAANSVVVSGPRDDVEALALSLGGAGIAHRMLRTRHAFHSPAFRDAAAALNRFAAALPLHKGSIPVVSNLDGKVLAHGDMHHDYWGRHILAPVRFAQGIDTLAALGVTAFLEVGPDRILASLIARDHGAVRAVHSLSGRDQDGRSLRQAAGALFELGFDAALDAVADAAPWRPAALPARQLRRTQYWTAGAKAAQPAAMPAIPGPPSAAGTDLSLQPGRAAPVACTQRDDAGALHGLVDRQIAVMRAQLMALDEPSR